MRTADNLFPTLEPATYAALKDSIEQFGVLVPVAKDQDGKLIDGYHRSKIADELGVDFRVDVIKVESDEQRDEIAPREKCVQNTRIGQGGFERRHAASDHEGRCAPGSKRTRRRWSVCFEHRVTRANTRNSNHLLP